jgi:hypothetical protein
MRRLLVVVIVGGLVWYGWSRHHEASKAAEVETPEEARADAAYLPVGGSTSTDSEAQYSCDGRTYCSQMTSCAEATYFIRNCPNTKMDGNNDGVPCESQWCK